MPAPAEIADEVASRLISDVEHAAGGVQLRDGAVVFWVSPSQRDLALSSVRDVVQSLASEGHPVDASSVAAVDAVPEIEWRDAWKRHFRTTRLTRQLVVVPSWEKLSDRRDVGEDDRILHLDPGQAFGTGAHASTQLVLQAMQGLVDSGIAVDRVLDVGTGSGILSIAAVKLWPGARAVATDIDPLAVDVAIENCAANQVTEEVTVSGSDLLQLKGQFGLVLANIQADVLTQLSSHLCERLAPGGHLVLSGLLSHQCAEIAQMFVQRHHLQLRAITESELDPEWSAAWLTSHGAP